MVKFMRCSPKPVRDGHRDFEAKSVCNTYGKRITRVKNSHLSVALLQSGTNKSENTGNPGEPNKLIAQNLSEINKAEEYTWGS